MIKFLVIGKNKDKIIIVNRFSIKMTTNLVLMKENQEVVDLGFDKTLFLEKDFILVTGDSKKEVLQKIKKGKQQGKLVVVRVGSEEMLRFVVEKTPADMVVGQELINPKDSVHYVRGGMDQVIFKICSEKGKIVGFSFADILKVTGKERSLLLSRMLFNIKLCKKYKVKCFFGSFSASVWGMRKVHDLKAFWEVLGGVSNCLEL